RESSEIAAGTGRASGRHLPGSRLRWWHVYRRARGIRAVPVAPLGAMGSAGGRRSAFCRVVGRIGTILLSGSPRQRWISPVSDIRLSYERRALRLVKASHGTLSGAAWRDDPRLGVTSR